MRNLLNNTGHPGPSRSPLTVLVPFYEGVHGAIRRACDEGLITNNDEKTPLVIPFQIFKWSELQPLPAESLQVAVYERINVVDATASYAVIVGANGEPIGRLQPDRRTVVDDENNVVGVRNVDGTLMATPLSGIHDVVAEDTTAFIVIVEGERHETIGALHPDGKTIVFERTGAGGLTSPRWAQERLCTWSFARGG